MSGYDALAELAERELELVSAGEIEGLTALREQRTALVATLPPTPPAAARPALERAAALQARVTEALAERVRDGNLELRHVSRGRTAVRGYAAPGAPIRLVDHSG